MSFISYQFVIFVLITSFLYYVLPKKFQKYVLVLANVYFYVTSSKWLSLFLLASMLTIYFCGRLFNKIKKDHPLDNLKDKDEKKKVKLLIKKEKKLVLVYTILINLVFLLVLKYNNLFVEISNDIFKSNFTAIKFLLPLGISYYTLEAISYVVDTYYEKYEATSNFIDIALYLSFFPLMVEGPISRYNQLAPQFSKSHKFNYEKYKSGLVLIGWGVIKKLVIADRAGIFVDHVFGHNYGGSVVIIAMLLYTLQIYAEFSGGIDIARGVAELFDIDVVENFKRPFFSTSIAEFWRRWHITLGTWLKDYIFYPISVSKANLKLSNSARKWKFKYLGRFVVIAFPLFFVWFTNGLWHGPSLKYIVYGLYYYVLMMLGVLLKPFLDFICKTLKIKTETFGFKLFRILRTILIVVIGMTIFRANNLTAAFETLKSVFNNNIYPVNSFGLMWQDFGLLLVMSMVIFFVGLIEEKGIDIRKKLDEQNLAFQWIFYLTEIYTIIIFGVYGAGFNAASFIYGGF